MVMIFPMMISSVIVVMIGACSGHMVHMMNFLVTILAMMGVMFRTFLLMVTPMMPVVTM
jgi:hypothetical protein